jgi:hypothetical protein
LVAPPDRLAACSSAATASAGRSSSCRAHKGGRQRAKPRIAVCSRQAAVAWPRGATRLEGGPAAKVRLVPLRAQRGARVGVAQRLPRLAQLQEGGAAVAARIDEERAVRARQQPGRRIARDAQGAAPVDRSELGVGRGVGLDRLQRLGVRGRGFQVVALRREEAARRPKSTQRNAASMALRQRAARERRARYDANDAPRGR